MQNFALLISLVAALRADTQQGAKVNPVQKVTQLLEKLQAEIEGEGKAEAAAYDKFACFCKEQADNKQYAIEKFTGKISQLDAEIEAKTTKKAGLDDEIRDHQIEIDNLTGDQEEAQGVRDSEHEAYVEKSSDLANAVSKFDRAISQVKGGDTNLLSTTVRESVALAESLRVPKEKFLNLVQADPHASEFHSGAIVSTLTSLMKDFKAKKIETDKEEQATHQEFSMSSGARRNQITAEEHSKSQKAQMSAQLESELNAAGTDLQQTTAAKTADSAFLADLTLQCEQKATDWDQRSSKRTAELTAMAAALELLKGNVAKMYSANNLGLMSVKKTSPSKRSAPLTEAMQTEADTDSYEDEMDDEVPATFLQIRRPNFQAERKEVVGFIAKKASQLKSPMLSTLLLKIRDAPTPFAKVKQMITDLVDRLEAEASSEQDQKSWCDDNMEETNKEKDTAQTNVESLNALLTEKSALSAQLTAEINTLAEEIAQSINELNEATELRDAERDENQDTVSRAQAGGVAIGDAIEVLNGFYNPGFLQRAPAAGYERFEAEGAGADGQTVGDMAPDAGGVSGEYGGKTDASKSIITLMEQIKEDFESTVSATTTDENAAEAAFLLFKGESESSQGDKATLKGTKEDERETAKSDISTANADLKRENGLLQAALDELVKLKPVCVDSGMSYKERTERRNQEIDALKDALKLLQNTDFGL